MRLLPQRQQSVTHPPENIASSTVRINNTYGTINVMLPELRAAGPGCQQRRLNVALPDVRQLEGATPRIHQDPVAGLACALRPAARLGSDSPIC